MLKLKLHYFGHLMQTADSLEKALMLGKIEGRRRRGWQRMRWLDGITDSMDRSFEQALGVGDGQGSLACCSPWGCKESDTTERLNWTELTDRRQPVPTAVRCMERFCSCVGSGIWARLDKAGHLREKSVSPSLGSSYKSLCWSSHLVSGHCTGQEGTWGPWELNQSKTVPWIAQPTEASPG